MPSKREISFQFTETNQTKSASLFSMKSDEVMFHIEIRTNESHLSGLTRLTSLVCLGFQSPITSSTQPGYLLSQTIYRQYRIRNFTQWRQILFNLPFELFSISFKKNSKGKLKRIWRHWWSIFKNFLKLPSFSQMVSSWNKAREKQSQPIRVVIEVNTLSLSGLFTDPAEGVGLGPDQPQLCKHYSWIKFLDWPIDSYSRGDIDNYIIQKTT